MSLISFLRNWLKEEKTLEEEIEQCEMLTIEMCNTCRKQTNSLKDYE